LSFCQASYVYRRAAIPLISILEASYVYLQPTIPLIFILEAPLSYLSPDKMATLFAIKSIMVREMHDETNLSCIFKAITQNAFGHRQIFVFMLLCS